MALRNTRAPASHHTQPRWGDPSNSRSYGDPTDMVQDVHHKLAKEQLIPQIAARTKNAIAVDRREVFFYQRLREGRRCVCWSSGESSPHHQCPVCLATGFAGGYLKWGTDLYHFEPSRQWWGVNTVISPLLGVPFWFTLEKDTTSGYIEWDQEMKRSTYYGLDSWGMDYRRGQGSVTFLYMLEGSDPTFIPFSEDSFKQRLLIAGGGRFRFKLLLTRPTTSDESPTFLHFWFRPLTVDSEQPVLYVDVPRKEESNVLAEYGVLETFNQIQFAFPSDKIQKINLEDMIVKLEDMTRWKIIEQSPNDPLGILTSFDIQARKVFRDEAMMNVPL
jgi:hypothetical protein